MQDNTMSFTPRVESQQVWKIQKSLYTALVVSFLGILILSIIFHPAVYYFIVACAAGIAGFLGAARVLAEDNHTVDRDYYADMINRNSDTVYMVYDLFTMQLQFTSSSVKSLLEYTPYELLKRNDFFFLDSESRDEITGLLERCEFADNKNLAMTTRAKTKSGNQIWMNIEVKVVPSDNDKIYGFVMLKDISLAKEQEHASLLYVRELEQLLRKHKSSIGQEKDHLQIPKPAYGAGAILSEDWIDRQGQQSA